MSINSFTFDGVSSEDMGLYVGGQKTFGAPQRDVTKVSIPGRNGDLVRDNGRFLNSEIAYNIVAMNDFKETAQNVRNWLMSAKGYKRLEDTYHPEHYRMARVSGGIDFETGAYNATGKAQILFDCMPQRFLKLGEIAEDATEIISQEYTGDPASFESTDVYEMTSAAVNLTPQQDTSGGVPSPTNICPITGYTESTLYVSPTTSSADATAYPVSFSSAGTVYGGTYDWVSGVLTMSWAAVDLGTLSWRPAWDTGTGTIHHFGADLSSLGIKSIALSAVSSLKCSAYETTSFNGLKDCAIAQSVVNICIKDDRYADATSFSTAMNGVQMVYELATPITYNLTPQTVNTLAGQNYVWAEEAVTVTFDGPLPLVNPTPFDAKPLIRVYGSGTCTFTINNQIITINNVTDFVDIDCETMNCYNGVVNKNADVVLGAQGFPVLPAGKTMIKTGGGTTKIEITPRWWEV